MNLSNNSIGLKSNDVLGQIKTPNVSGATRGKNNEVNVSAPERKSAVTNAQAKSQELLSLSRNMLETLVKDGLPSEVAKEVTNVIVNKAQFVSKVGTPLEIDTNGVTAEHGLVVLKTMSEVNKPLDFKVYFKYNDDIYKVGRINKKLSVTIINPKNIMSKDVRNKISNLSSSELFALPTYHPSVTSTLNQSYVLKLKSELNKSDGRIFHFKANTSKPISKPK